MLFASGSNRLDKIKNVNLNYPKHTTVDFYSNEHYYFSKDEITD